MNITTTSLFMIIIFLIVAIFAIIIYFNINIKLILNIIDETDKPNKNFYIKRIAYINIKIKHLIKQNKQLRKKYLANEEYYNIISSFSDDIVFLFDTSDEKIIINWKNQISQITYTEIIKEKKLVYPDDIPALENFFETLIQSKNADNIEIRISLDTNQNYNWYLLKAKTINTENNVLKIIVKAINIDKQKKETEILKIKAQRDQLTGLYNKETTYIKIENILKQFSQNSHAIFIFDIDNFKAVNDNFGHLFGDVVLSDVAYKMKSLFRTSDVLGRIGGDEFLACMRDINDEKLVINRAEEVNKALRHTINGDNLNCKISGSIGISIYPKDGRTLKELIKNADNALYNAKLNGKDCFQIFNASTPEQHYIQNSETREEVHRVQKTFEENLLRYIFQILYQSSDVENAINLILGLVGKYYDVSRCYVFENTDDNLYCNNTFEWCNDGIDSQIDNLQNIAYDNLDNYYDNFNENGIFYCKDINEIKPSVHKILALQNVCSLLQCAIINNNKFKGYVGFDECKENRLWTEKEISTLTLVSKILSISLIKMRVQDRLAKSNEIVHSILDKQNIWTYIIQKETYKLLFINKRISDLIKSLAVNDICYKAIMNKDKPCDFCPIKKLKNTNNASNSAEIYHQIYKLWVNATVSEIQWKNGEIAYLMYCFDITKYKQ